MANKIRNYSGVKVGRLLVLSKHGRNKSGRVVWLCQCDCGRLATRTSDILKKAIDKKQASHCGCSPPGETHKLSQKEKHLYWVWAAMIQRCVNPANKDFENYGGRGIHVCNDWRFDFKSFHDWAKSSGYKRGLTIERIDVDQGYKPENCTWIENERQALNTSRSAMIEFKGEAKHISDWAREYNLNYKTLRGRIFDYGWDIERALTTRLRGKAC